MGRGGGAGGVYTDSNGDGVDDWYAARLQRFRATKAAETNRGRMLEALGLPAGVELKIVSSPGDIPGLEKNVKNDMKKRGWPSTPAIYSVDEDRVLVTYYTWSKAGGALTKWYLIVDSSSGSSLEGKILAERLGDFQESPSLNPTGKVKRADGTPR